MQTVTEAYTLGIREGRNTLKSFPDLDPTEEHKAAQRLMMAHDGIMKDFFKGQRDFWKNQRDKQTR